MQPQPPPEEDPYRSMWQMSPVADMRAGGKAGRRRSNLRIVPGIIGGVVTLIPFGVVTSTIWGWWQGESTWSGGGWAILVIGLAAAFAVAAFVASAEN
jgi:hypothetical protein